MQAGHTRAVVVRAALRPRGRTPENRAHDPTLELGDEAIPFGDALARRRFVLVRGDETETSVGERRVGAVQ
jgi:hypothetical protein